MLSCMWADIHMPGLEVQMEFKYVHIPDLEVQMEFIYVHMPGL